MESTGNSEVISGDNRVEIKGAYDLSVFYEDTDLSGYVYHANYLKFFERARSTLISVELVRDLYNKGVHFVVAGANLKYKRPALYGDRLTVKTNLTFTRSPRTIVTQNVYKNGSDRPIVEGEVELVLVNREGKPVETPDFMFEMIETYLKN